jgi:lipopolysaccharide/colanic/teichoic acid biosynthesis glycosyltransferase
VTSVSAFPSDSALSPGIKDQVLGELSDAIDRLRRPRPAGERQESPRFEYPTGVSVDDALAVFAQRQQAYAESIDQGLRDLNRLANGERPESEAEGIEPWPELVEALANWHPPVRKRVFDLVTASLALVILSPLLIVIAVLIKLDSHGPSLFRQRRTGRDGKTFDALKFRTMVADADLAERYLGSESELGLFKLSADPRITRVGGWLRAHALDELPQLLNVLRGDMSLVGPRALVSWETPAIAGWERYRLHIKPGLTGPWQLRSRIATTATLHEMIRQDYLYAARWSLWLDVKIFLRTIGAVVQSAGGSQESADRG